MVANELCSSGLFCLSNISYERFGRRSLLINRGLTNLMPRMAIWWCLLRACNMAALPSLNLLGETGLLSSLVSWSWCLMFVLVLLSFFFFLPLLLFICILIVSVGLFILLFILVL
jgi:NADH-ubiquinone oxidoreductase chain 4